MADSRRAGLLLHPTSLPGPHGVGDLGPFARRLLSWMDMAKLSVWQMLPVVPVDGSGCPYASPSAFARNALLISFEDLVQDGWLRPDEVPAPFGHRDQVDFVEAHSRRGPVLEVAADRVAKAVDLQPFVQAHPWVRDWSLYHAIWQKHGPCWTAWPAPLRDREPRALAGAQDELARAIARETAVQWLFEEQWGRLRAEAQRRGIRLWGDIPFFVSGESCDTWAHRHLFRLDAQGRPTVRSGVPPDAFSATGQLWGHPLYDEAAHRDEGYRWWTDRVQAQLDLVDEARLDHFRGLAAYWEVPAGAEDARGGHWIPGPGEALLRTLQERLGRLPLVAEDLGVITPDVEKLRDDFQLPGMVVLQFAFGNPDDTGNPHIPFRHLRRSVVFTGTHDNDTAVGWYTTAEEQVRDHMRRYASADGRDPAWTLIQCAYRSVAATAIVPMQDFLRLGSTARLNRPGAPEGNWGWRLRSEALDPHLARRIADEARIGGRRA